MAIPIFWRLILGYSVILTISIGLSSYSIIQLGKLSDSARTALNTDQRMIEYEEKLADTILSEVRYGRKFIITQVSTLRQQFLQFSKDFGHYLQELKNMTDTPEIKARLARVEEYHLRYQDLFAQEIGYLKSGQAYAQTRYREEKEKAVESVLGELEALKAQLQKNVHAKLGTIEEAARITRKVAVLVSVVLFALGLGLSFLISKSITNPILELQQKAAAAERTGPESGADYSRIPEIQGLAAALNDARAQLRIASRSSAGFVESVREQFATPLMSIRERLCHLKNQLNPTTTPEQRKQLDILIAESERLTRLLAELPQPRDESPSDFKRHPRPAMSRPFGIWHARHWLAAWTPMAQELLQSSRAAAGACRRRTLAFWTTVKELGILAYGKAKK